MSPVIVSANNKKPAFSNSPQVRKLRYKGAPGPRLWFRRNLSRSSKWLLRSLLADLPALKRIGIMMSIGAPYRPHSTVTARDICKREVVNWLLDSRSGKSLPYCFVKLARVEWLPLSRRIGAICKLHIRMYHD